MAMYLAMKLEGLDEEMVKAFKGEKFEAIEWNGDNVKEVREFLSWDPVTWQGLKTKDQDNLNIKGQICKPGDYIVLLARNPFNNSCDPGLVHVYDQKTVLKQFDVVGQHA